MRHYRTRLLPRAAEPFIHMSLCPDKPILAGFLGSFALYQLPALAGRHDGRNLISLTRSSVNNPNPIIQSGRVVLGAYAIVSQKEGILLANLLHSSMSTFSWESLHSLFAFKEGMWDTQISGLGGWATVSGRDTVGQPPPKF